MVRRGILQMGKLWLQCRLELELAVLQDVFLFLQCPPNQKRQSYIPRTAGCVGAWAFLPGTAAFAVSDGLGLSLGPGITVAPGSLTMPDLCLLLPVLIRYSWLVSEHFPVFT